MQIDFMKLKEKYVLWDIKKYTRDQNLDAISDCL